MGSAAGRDGCIRIPRIAIVPVPAFAARLARALAPDMVDRLMRSSVLAPSANVLAAGTSAPVAAETQVLESSPVAAEAAEGTQAADAPAPAKKPRAKKQVEG